MDEFYTRDAANEGIKLELSLPDGTPSAHWVRVRGIDSDAFRRADAKGRRHAFKVAQIEDDDEQQMAIDAMKLEIIAALVVDWSFAKECTQESIIDFLGKAPQIADQIDKVATQRARFFSKKSESSSTLQKRSSSSKKPRKAQSKA